MIRRNPKIKIIKKQNLLIVDDVVYDLTPRLRKTLEYFCSNQDQVVTKREILENVWGNISVSDDSISQSVSQLRRLLSLAGIDQEFIKTVRGVGYHIGIIHDFEIISQPSSGPHSSQLPLHPHQWAIPLVTIIVFFLALVFDDFSTEDCCWDATRLTYTTSWERKPTVSPLGNFVTYTRFSSDGTSSIFIQRLNNNEEEKRIGTRINANYFAPIFNPSEQIIYAMRFNSDDTCDIVSILVEINLETTIGDCTHTQHPRLSINTDGTRLAFQHNQDSSSIKVINLENYIENIIYKEEDYSVQITDPLFDFDNNIIFMRRFLDGNSEFVKLYTEDGSLRSLLTNKQYITGPTLYEDNIIYTVRQSNGNGLFNYNTSTGVTTRIPISDQSASYPSLSSDGRIMTYGSVNNRRELGFVFIDRANQTLEYTKIDGFDGLIFDVDISHHDSSIFYQMEQEGLSSIWNYNLENSETSLFLSHYNHSISTPRHSPSEDLIAYIEKSGSTSFVKLEDPLNETLNRTIYESEDHITSMEWSPDGTRLTFLITSATNLSQNALVHYDVLDDSIVRLTINEAESIRYNDDNRLFLTRYSDQFIYEIINNNIVCITCDSQLRVNNRSWVIYRNLILNFEPYLFDTIVTGIDISNPDTLIDFGTLNFPTSTIHRTFRLINDQDGILLAIGRPHPSGDVYFIEIPDNSIFQKTGH